MPDLPRLVEDRGTTAHITGAPATEGILVGTYCAVADHHTKVLHSPNRNDDITEPVSLFAL